jgi:hypothetical protein
MNECAAIGFQDVNVLSDGIPSLSASIKGCIEELNN